MEHIIKNQARCLVCGEIIESKYRNNHVTCSCGNLSVDGGQDYIRRGYMSDKWHELSVFDPYQWGDAFVSTDGHAWCQGVDLLRCPRSETGETALLPARVPVGRKLPTLVQCKVYSIDAKIFDRDIEAEKVYIAVGQQGSDTVVKPS